MLVIYDYGGECKNTFCGLCAWCASSCVYRGVGGEAMKANLDDVSSDVSEHVGFSPRC